MISTNTNATNMWRTESGWIAVTNRLSTSDRGYAFTTNNYISKPPPVPWYQEQVDVMWIPTAILATLLVAYTILAVARNSWNLR